MGGGNLCRLISKSSFFGAGNFGVELVRDRARYLAFDAKDVVQLAIIAFGPNMFVVRSANQLNVDVNGVSDFLNAAFKQVGDA